MRIDGESGFKAGVNKFFQLLGLVTSENPLLAASKRGEAWCFESGTRNIDAGDTILFIKNTAADPLYLFDIMLNGSNVICEYTIGLGKTTTTPSANGGDVVPADLNTLFTTDAGVIAMWDEDAVATATALRRFWAAVAGTAVNPPEYSLSGIILAKNHYCQVTQVTASTSGSVHISAYREIRV